MVVGGIMLVIQEVAGGWWLVVAVWLLAGFWLFDLVAGGAIKA